MTLFPARLGPMFVPRIWGARSLAPLYPQKQHLKEPIGEVWLTGNDCILETGPWAGQKLAAAWRAMPPEWAGTRMDTRAAFPLLVKFLFPEQWLSVQVHPTDEYAREHEAAAGGVGKTEMWHALSAREGASVLVGLNPDTRPEDFRIKISDGTVEDCIQRLPVSAGDTIFVPAGTVHTIGPGMVLCEIQENSDITYRIFDYGRTGPDGKSRALHIDQALAVTRFGPQRGGKIVPFRVEPSPRRRDTFCVACPYFATELWEFTEPLTPRPSHEHFDLLIILSGVGHLHAEGHSAEYAPAQVWLVPAGLRLFELRPSGETRLLRTCVPDLDELTRHFQAHRIAEESWSRVVFR